jgi:hypothetical protein
VLRRVAHEFAVDLALQIQDFRYGLDDEIGLCGGGGQVGGERQPGERLLEAAGGAASDEEQVGASARCRHPCPRFGLDGKL